MDKVVDKDINYQVGIPESLRSEAVALYEAAFGAKFSVAIKNKQKRLQLLHESLWLDSAIGAVADNQLLGLAGFSTAKGSLTKGVTTKRLFKNLGILGGLRAVVIFGLYERKAKAGELLMDGIVVSDKLRGYGIGSELLQQIKQYATENDYSTIRLDVIDTNNAAKRLYEKRGFEATETQHFEYLRWLLGFGASTTMSYKTR